MCVLYPLQRWMCEEDIFVNRFRISMQHPSHRKTGRAEWSLRGADLKGGAESSSVLEEKLLLFSFWNERRKEGYRAKLCFMRSFMFCRTTKANKETCGTFMWCVCVCACVQTREIRGESATTCIVALRWCVLCRAGKTIWAISFCCVDQPLKVQSSQVLWLRGRDCQRSGKSIRFFLRWYLCITHNAKIFFSFLLISRVNKT